MISRFLVKVGEEAKPVVIEIQHEEFEEPIVVLERAVRYAFDLNRDHRLIKGKRIRNSMSITVCPDLTDPTYERPARKIT